MEFAEQFGTAASFKVDVDFADVTVKLDIKSTDRRDIGGGWYTLLPISHETFHTFHCVRAEALIVAWACPNSSMSLRKAFISIA